MKQKKSQSVVAIAIGAIVIIVACLIWHFRNSKVSGPEVEEKIKTLLRSDCSFEFTNSWQAVYASGGLVGSPFYSIRWWREYFLEVRGDLAAYESLSNSLGSRHWTTGFSFLPPIDHGYRVILPHRVSTNLASWWQPETNCEPMLSAQIGDGGRSVFIYGFKKNTNALVYVHVIER